MKHHRNDTMTVAVFLPSHLTCFFSIFNNENPLKKGSCGAGILIDKGVITKAKSSKKDKIAIKSLQNIYSPIGSNDIISKKTIEYMKNHFKIEEGISITHEIEVPLGSGFGTSASSSLGIAIAINKLFDLKIENTKLYQIAHRIEIELGSGLGDVIAETSHGIVIRTKPGAPGIGEVKNILSSDAYVITKTLGEIDTSSIIQNPIIAKKINEIGILTQNKFLKYPSIENLIKCSYNFSKKTGLMNNELLEIIKQFKNNNLDASMVMLGNTIFALSKDPYCDMEDVLISKIDNEGMKFL
ncbi:homoserine kinase [Methanobrevibacter cuticularis]|uniref:Pantoate kinase n=1 Tax=Methanobrevibacter cuticularis TaxID=47311 RepID=A0A166EX96_9EURY|nr:pantoate kinase [Methanobrevibacter cuticularis]KZX17110.1 homoserine kinase [Methanobrevibacter cuticularis]